MSYLVLSEDELKKAENMKMKDAAKLGIEVLSEEELKGVLSTVLEDEDLLSSSGDLDVPQGSCSLILDILLFLNVV